MGKLLWKNEMSKSEINKECLRRLKECMDNAKMKNKDLAELANYSEVYISNLVTGHRPMSADAAKRIAPFLGVLDTYLLCESDCRTQNEQYIRDASITDILSDGLVSYYIHCGLVVTKTTIITPDGRPLSIVPPRINFPRIDGKAYITVDGNREEIYDVYQEIEIEGKQYLLNGYEFSMLEDTIENAVRTAIRSFAPVLDHFDWLRKS